MITVRVTDGLGNQLFQYACGRALAEYHKEPLRLDIHHYTHSSYRNYLLDKFGIAGQVLTESESERLDSPFKDSKLGKMLFRLKQHTFRGCDPKYIVETPITHFLSAPRNMSKIRHTTNHAYLVGYWQRLEYFMDIRNLLLKELQPQWNLSDKSRSIVLDMKQSNSVGISVRRGDYTLPHNRTFYGLLESSFYVHAAHNIRDRTTDPNYFIFSDDNDWARSNIKCPGRTVFVTHNHGLKPHDDLFLLSCCKHHVIANSTFSWWGAWLADDGGIVIAPEQWLAGRSTKSLGLLAQNWLTL